MAKKVKAKVENYEVPDDIMDKAQAYANRLNVDVDRVIELALRDWFYDLESGQRPRSASELEPGVLVAP